MKSEMILQAQFMAAAKLWINWLICWIWQLQLICLDVNVYDSRCQSTWQEVCYVVRRKPWSFRGIGMQTFLRKKISPSCPLYLLDCL